MVLACALPAAAQQAGEPPAPRPIAGIEVGTFAQEVGRRWGPGEGLDAPNVTAVAVAPGDGAVFVATDRGVLRRQEDRFVPVAGLPGPARALGFQGADLIAVTADGLYRLGDDGARKIAAIPGALAQNTGPWSLAARETIWLGTSSGLWELRAASLEPCEEVAELLGEGDGREVRQVAAASDDRVAVAASGGLLLRADGRWQRLQPRARKRSWAADDVRGVGFDRADRLWFACPQGVGRLDPEGWTLFTGAEGLPYDDFTTVAAGEEGVVWFGTAIGAIRFDGTNWEYRQGRRWIPDDRVRGIAVDGQGNAWLATAGGLGSIERQPMTLAQKARFFEDEIDKYHRRTPYGYVLGVGLEQPGDKSRSRQSDSDNDGLWTSMYGAGECFAYAATKDPKARERAKAAFEAVRFLSQVTQGGSHPAPPGFPARSILPTDGPDPNVGDSPERDRREQLRDPYWKVISPRWPKSADGKWYWKTDTSSDELDGHFFLYAVYHDLVAETPEEKARVREVVTAIVDHLIANDYNLIDHDGRPTRWARFGPSFLNKFPDAADLRGLNSLSILSYLKVAEHVSGDPKYRAAYDSLVRDHDYAANTRDPKRNLGPGTGNQSDDEMAFMCYYNLLNYETDPALRLTYRRSLRYYWSLEAPERCPLFHFILAVRGNEPDRRWPGVPALAVAESVESLQRFPLDRVRWGLKNSHRTDIVPMTNPYREPSGGRGRLRDGRVLPIDERYVGHWNHDPWQLDVGGDGRSLADGAAFLLPYYLGRYHGFVIEPPDVRATSEGVGTPR